MRVTVLENNGLEKVRSMIEFKIYEMYFNWFLIASICRVIVKLVQKRVRAKQKNSSALQSKFHRTFILVMIIKDNYATRYFL